MAVFINMDVGVKVRGWDAPPFCLGDILGHS